MTAAIVADVYRAYIDCLNTQDWDRLGVFVHRAVQRNGTRLGLDGYRRMLESDFDAIPDLQFTIELIVTEGSYVSSRLAFDCTPKGALFGYAVNGRRVQFHENVFYHFTDGRIDQVWSIIDTAAIAGQL